MGVSLDTRKAHLTRQHGDIIAIYTWVNDERALVLLPAHRRRAPWYIVMDSAAWTWDDSTPANVPAVAAKAMKACEVLGIEPTPRNARRIATIIVDGMPDLISMPSAPPPEYLRGNFGSMQLREDGKLIAERPIQVESEGVEFVADHA